MDRTTEGIINIFSPKKERIIIFSPKKERIIIYETRMFLRKLEETVFLNVTLANQIKAFRSELELVEHSLISDVELVEHSLIDVELVELKFEHSSRSWDAHIRCWVNLLEEYMLQPIRNGVRMHVDLCEHTISNLLQIIDDCPTIDNIYKYLEELENQWDLTMHVKNQIQNLKLQLRNLRMHLKLRTFVIPSLATESYYRMFMHLRSWVRYVEECLLQSTRKGCMKFLEETLSSLLDIMSQTKWSLSKNFCGYIDKELPFIFGYPDAPIADLMEWIDQVLDNVKHLIQWNERSSVVLSLKEQIETWVEKVEFLRNIFRIAGKEFEEVIKNDIPMSGPLHKTSENLLNRIKKIIYKATCVSWYILDDSECGPMEEFFLVLLANIDHIEPEIRMTCVQLLKGSKIANQRTLGIDLQALATVDSLLDNLQKLLKDQDNGSFMHLDVHEIEILCQKLCFVKYFLMHPHMKQHNEIEALLIQVEADAWELEASLTEDHLPYEMQLVHANLLKNLNRLNIKIREMYLRIPRQSISNFPRSPKLGFVNFFIQSLEELLQHRANSIAYVKHEVKTLLSELTLSNFFVKNSTKNFEKNDSIASDIVNVAYEAEQVIDLISASHFPKWYYTLWLSDVIEKIKKLREDCPEVLKIACEISNMKIDSSTNNPNRAYNLSIEEEMVGFDPEAQRIIDQLIGGKKHLDIVSIVGMPGQGKTTLAKKVYEDPSIRMHFHVRSWYCISQVYDRQDLLCSILDNLPQAFPPKKRKKRKRKEKNLPQNDEDLAEMLCKSVNDVLDDLSQKPSEKEDEDVADEDEDKADELRKNLKGRRYLIVLDDIWSIKPWNDIQNSFPDDCNGSRILFTSRIREIASQANPNSAPPHDLRLFSDEESWELLQNKVFKQRSCPPEIYPIGKKIAKNCNGLPLSVVLLAGVLVKLEESKDHWKQVLASLGKQVGDLSKCILELSYKQLPDHLKPCFLYLGAFPENREIPTWKLIRLWIAEGFIQKKTENERLEDVAEDYLMDLISRSLVLIAQRKSNEGIKSCHVHDLLREFSMQKAKDENFFLISKEMPCDLGQYRHCFHNVGPYIPYVRSVFFYPRSIFYVGSNLVLSYDLKLLKVFCLQYTEIGNNQFQRLTEVLVHLRYLEIEGPLVHHVPSSVANLWRLETLILRRSGVVSLPEALLELVYLKHVYISKSAFFELSDHREKSIKSACIVKFSTLCLDHRTLENVITRLRSLQKLKCIFLKRCDKNGGRHQFPELCLLSELESLNMEYCPDPKITTVPEFSFPSNLKKLTLSRLDLAWSEISKIRRLPQLKVLKLLYNAFKGPRWDANDDEEFWNLKFLKLKELDIEEWDASPDVFPCLEKLVVESCWRLKEIPSSFGGSSTLQMIDVKSCRRTVTKVLEIEKDNMGAEFKVVIQDPLSESELEVLHKKLKKIYGIRI